MKESVRKDKNRGFTLIELIVSFTVASIVILGIGTLLSVGTRSYYNTNTETTLQKESQIAMNQINDLMIKAQAYEFKPVNVSGVLVPTLVITASEESSPGNTQVYYYAIIFDQAREQLLFRKDLKSSVGDTAEALEAWRETCVNDEIVSSTPSLLAKYINSLTIEPDASTINTEGSVQITLKLLFNGRDYSTFSTISFRNN